MEKFTLELTSDRPIELNLNSFKVKAALMGADMAGYVDKNIAFDPATSHLTITVKEKGIQMMEERLV